MIPMRIRPLGPGKPPSDGSPKRIPSLRPQIRGVPGRSGRIQPESAACAGNEKMAKQRIKPTKTKEAWDKSALQIARAGYSGGRSGPDAVAPAILRRFICKTEPILP